MSRLIFSATVCVAGFIAVAAVTPARAGTFDPQVGQPGSLGIGNARPYFTEWASSVVSITRVPEDIANPASPLASFGTPSQALGYADGVSTHVVSLGDGGSITLWFATPIANGPGADFAVFENGFLSGSPGLAFLELGFVDVSSDGVHFFRFPSVSETQTANQPRVQPRSVRALRGSCRPRKLLKSHIPVWCDLGVSITGSNRADGREHGGRNGLQRLVAEASQGIKPARAAAAGWMDGLPQSTNYMSKLRTGSVSPTLMGPSWLNEWSWNVPNQAWAIMQRRLWSTRYANFVIGLRTGAAAMRKTK
jgi:hypothetical protein